MSKLQTLREILGNLKRRRPAKRYCPKCGNPNIHLSSRFDIWLLPEQYICEKCGYKGLVTLELDEKQAPHHFDAAEQPT